VAQLGTFHLAATPDLNAGCHGLCQVIVCAVVTIIAGRIEITAHRHRSSSQDQVRQSSLRGCCGACFQNTWSVEPEFLQCLLIEHFEISIICAGSIGDAISSLPRIVFAQHRRFSQSSQTNHSTYGTDLVAAPPRRSGARNRLSIRLWRNTHVFGLPGYFRYGRIDHHAAFTDVAQNRVQSLAISPTLWN
jgi:hypothetical protein